MSYCVYILYSKSHDRYYVGQTNEISLRLKRHNSGDVFSTRPYRPWKLVYTENYPNRSAAIKREREIKSKKSRVYLEKMIKSAESR